MTARKIAILLGAACIAGAACSVAQAAEAPKSTDFTVHPDPSVAGGAGTMKWDAAHGRWGVTLNLQQPDNRERNWNDIQAGAYYRLTPSLRVGGAVALGQQQPQVGPNKLSPDAGQPRVRLETQFKF